MAHASPVLKVKAVCVWDQVLLRSLPFLSRCFLGESHLSSSRLESVAALASAWELAPSPSKRDSDSSVSTGVWCLSGWSKSSDVSCSVSSTTVCSNSGFVWASGLWAWPVHVKKHKVWNVICLGSAARRVSLIGWKTNKGHAALTFPVLGARSRPVQKGLNT